MSTVFKRLKHYCQEKKRPLPTLQERQEIGKQVVTAWYAQEKREIVFITKAETIEPEGNFKSMSYPQFFNEKIDQIISAHFARYPPNRKERTRTRIPIKHNAFKSNYSKLKK